MQRRYHAERPTGSSGRDNASSKLLFGWRGRATRCSTWNIRFGAAISPRERQARLPNPVSPIAQNFAPAARVGLRVRVILQDALPGIGPPFRFGLAGQNVKCVRVARPLPGGDQLATDRQVVAGRALEDASAFQLRQVTPERALARRLLSEPFKPSVGEPSPAYAGNRTWDVPTLPGSAGKWAA